MNTATQTYRVIKKIQETPTVATLYFFKENKKFSFIPGQYINVYFPETKTLEGKSYSISSTPPEKHFTLTVKAMGEFSCLLFNLKLGDTIQASLPYGFFFGESTNTDIVLLASGIGIAPYRSMIYDTLEKYPERKIILYYSTKTKVTAIFKKEFDKLVSRNFKVHYFFTQQGSPRIDPGKLVKDLPKLRSPEFFICGSISFVRDMWKGLLENGVSEDVIYTEAFFS